MATITVTPTTAAPGATVDIAGKGFSSKVKFNLTTVDSSGTEVGQTTNINRCKRDGTFAVGINVPTREGPAKVRAYQSGVMVAEAAITVAKVVTPPPPAPTTTWYISPTGSDATGDGSQAKPWGSIQKFINTNPAPGSTLLLRGGNYAQSQGGFTARDTYGSLIGTAAAPITIKNAPGEAPSFPDVAGTVIAFWPHEQTDRVGGHVRQPIRDRRHRTTAGPRRHHRRQVHRHALQLGGQATVTIVEPHDETSGIHERLTPLVGPGDELRAEAHDEQHRRIAPVTRGLEVDLDITVPGEGHPPTVPARSTTG